MINNDTNNSIIKVGIVDDHVSVANGYALLFNNMPGIRTTLLAYSGKEALNQLKEIKELPDILMMDVDMPGMDGIEVTKQITDLYPSIRTIAISSWDDDWAIVSMIKAGACAYLSKDSTPQQMEMAAREVFSKGIYQADLYYPNMAGLREYSKRIKDLSFTENEIKYIQLLCKGYRCNQIAKEMGLTLRGVEYLKQSICEKLNVKTNAEIILKAQELGIISRKPQKKNNF
jgi:DNA-binding NarL/FixJ family response regulator